jgi:hypothetical protein
MQSGKNVYPTAPFSHNYTYQNNLPMQPQYVLINGREIFVPPELQEDVSSGQAELIKEGMENHEARVCLILDVSSSMQEKNKFFSDEQKGNQIQTLINRALALAILFDDDKKVEVFPFGEKVFDVDDQGKRRPLVVDCNNFSKATDMILDLLDGSLRQHTNYSEPVKAVRKYYFNDSGPRTQKQLCDDAPVFAIFVTDGEPSEKKIEAMNQFRSASHQGIFFKFIALRGQQADQEFKFLTGVNQPPLKDPDTKNEDDLRNKFLMDNSNLIILNHPGELSMRKILEEYRPWLTEAHQVHHILTQHPGITFTDIQSEGRIANRMFQPKNKNKSNNDVPADRCCIIL